MCKEQNADNRCSLRFAHALMDTLKAEIAAAAARWVVEEGLNTPRPNTARSSNWACPPVPPCLITICGGRGARIHRAVLWRHTAPGVTCLAHPGSALDGAYGGVSTAFDGCCGHGTATRHSDIYIQLFCDDSKSAEIALIDHHVDYDPSTVRGFRGEPVEALTLGFEALPWGRCRPAFHGVRPGRPARRTQTRYTRPC